MCEEIINSWQDAGHADQIENRTGTEEDGLDECIVPSDRKPILDNVGSQIPNGNPHGPSLRSSAAVWLIPSLLEVNWLYVLCHLGQALL